MRSLLLAGLFLVLVLGVGCESQNEGNFRPIVELEVSTPTGTEIVQAEVADEPSELQQGLMHRESLGEREGMLFVFAAAGEHSFWMKDTLIPLDMIFLDEYGVIVDILKADPCQEEPCATYTPAQDAKYVLEVNQNFSEERELERGDKIEGVTEASS